MSESAIPKVSREATPHVVEWFAGLSADDLAAVELGNRLYWPAKINKQRVVGGQLKWEQLDVRLRTLDFTDEAAAKRDRKRLFADLGLDREEEPEAWEELLVYCRMSQAIRLPMPPYEPWQPPEFLINESQIGVTRAELESVRGKLEVFGAFNDARLHELSADQLVDLCLAIKRTGNLSPLVAIVGRELDTFVMFTACRLADYLLSSSPSSSPTTSTSGKPTGGSPKKQRGGS